LRQNGRRFSNAYFALSTLPSEQSHARLGLAIATRVFRTAVARNRIKRLVREWFRLNQHALAPLDIMVSAKEAAKGAAPRELRASLAGLLATLARMRP
jgi:ribonuclease P protein component